MMTTISDPVVSKESIIDIRLDIHQGKVRITLPDKHVMVVAVEEAAKACGEYVRQAAFSVQFDFLIERLAEWSHSHASQISQAYLTVRDRGLMFLVIRRDVQFNSDFEDELTALDVELANNHDLDTISVSVLALPQCPVDAAASFLASKSRFRIRFDLQDG